MIFVRVSGRAVQEVWSCWMELLQYLDTEQSWLNSLEDNVQATDNLPESTETVNEALEVHAQSVSYLLCQNN